MTRSTISPGVPIGVAIVVAFLILLAIVYLGTLRKWWNRFLGVPAIPDREAGTGDGTRENRQRVNGWGYPGSPYVPSKKAERNGTVNAPKQENGQIADET
jgi:hypothetical protein